MQPLQANITEPIILCMHFTIPLQNVTLESYGLFHRVFHQPNWVTAQFHVSTVIFLTPILLIWSEFKWSSLSTGLDHLGSGARTISFIQRVY